MTNLKTSQFENFENIKNDRWDMPNNFCFYVYAPKSLIISEISNVYFLTATSASASPSSVSLEVIELVPS